MLVYMCSVSMTVFIHYTYASRLQRGEKREKMQMLDQWIWMR